VKKIGIITLTLLLVAFAFASGCASNNGGNESGVKEAPAITELNIGYQPSTHQLAYMTAAEKGWWKEESCALRNRKNKRISISDRCS